MLRVSTYWGLIGCPLGRPAIGTCWGLVWGFVWRTHYEVVVFSCPSVLVLLHKIFNFAFSCTLRKVDKMAKNCHRIWEKFCHLDFFYIPKHIIEVVDDNFSKNDFELHSRLHEWEFYMKIQTYTLIQFKWQFVYFIILSFPAILMPTVCLSFTKLRFRRSFWGA